MKKRFPLSLALFVLISAALTAAGETSGTQSLPSISKIARNLGPQIRRAMIMRSDSGKDKNGQPVLYTVILGSPAILSIVNINTGKVVENLPLPNTSGAWGVKVSSDNSVYLGAYNEGLLYRYVPETGDLQNLGHPFSTKDAVLYPMDAMPDGKIYGGSYPSGHLYEFDPVTRKIRDLGDMTTTTEKERWIRVTVTDPVRHKVYLGIGNRPQLAEYDIATGSKRDLLPAKYDNITSVYDMNLADGRLICRKETHNANEYFVLDVATGQNIPVTNADTGETSETFVNTSRGLSPVSPIARKMYYADNARELCEYDLATNTIRKVGFNVRGALTGFSFVQLSDPAWPGYTLTGTVGNQPLLYRYNLTTGRGEVQTIDLPGQPVNIEDIITGPDGKIYTGGYLAGNMGVYDPATDTNTHYSGSGQTEGLAFIGDKLYMGIYPDAKIFEYDISKPWDMTPTSGSQANPLHLFNLTYNDSIAGYTNQDRPWALTGSAETKKLFIGTTPKNGMLGGVLAMWDIEKRTSPVVQWNIIPDQSIVSLVLYKGILYGGTSIHGGLGVKPTQTSGELFAWDPATQQKLYSLEPVPGKASVSALHVGPDGKIWGLAQGTIFKLDPESRNVVYRQDAFPDASGKFKEGNFLNHPDGKVYGTANHILFSIEPDTMKVTPIATGCRYVVQDKRGRLYAFGAEQTILYQWDPAGEK